MTARPNASGRLYDSDFYAWTQDQAAKLRARINFDNRGDIDWENAAEEIESLGRSEEREIESRLIILVLHLLKWRYQPSHRSSGWKGSILEQRGRLARRLTRNPSLKRYPAEILDDVYGSSVADAVSDTGFAKSMFPQDCPFSIDEILDKDFYPKGAGE